MLNPSTADAEVDDPTIRKCRGFAQRMGYGRICVGNLFAYRATDPHELIRAANRSMAEAIGPDNDRRLAAMVADADDVILAWGSYGERFAERCELVGRMVDDFKCYRVGKLTKAGHPRHPLMLGYNARLTRWKP